MIILQRQQYLPKIIQLSIYYYFQMFILIKIIAFLTLVNSFQQYFDTATRKIKPPLYASKLKMGSSISNNDLMIYTLTKVQSQNTSQLYGRNAILINSYMHARQIYSLNLIKSLHQNIIQSANSGELDYFLNNGVFIFYPFVNIDGFQLYNQQQGIRNEVRKNLNTKNIRCSSGMAGVDINRNFPYSFGFVNQSSRPCSEQYHGQSPFSERQALVFKNLFETFKILIAIDIHSYGNEWIYPFASDISGEKVKQHRLYPFYTEVIQKFQSNDRIIRSCIESLKYIADGVYIDWALEQNALSFAFEVGKTFRHDANIDLDIKAAIPDFYGIFEESFSEQGYLRIKSKTLINMTITINITNRYFERYLISGQQISIQLLQDDIQAHISIKEINSTQIKYLKLQPFYQNVITLFMIAVAVIIIIAFLIVFYRRLNKMSNKNRQQNVMISLEQVSMVIE